MIANNGARDSMQRRHSRSLWQSQIFIFKDERFISIPMLPLQSPHHRIACERKDIAVNGDTV